LLSQIRPLLPQRSSIVSSGITSQWQSSLCDQRLLYDAGFRLHQEHIDHAFRLCVDNVDEEAMSWMLSQHYFAVSVEVVNDFYSLYSSEGYRMEISKRLSQWIFTRLHRSPRWKRAVTTVDAVLWVLDKYCSQVRSLYLISHTHDDERSPSALSITRGFTRLR